MVLGEHNQPLRVDYRVRFCACVPGGVYGMVEKLLWYN